MPETSMDVLFAKQPIYDANRNLYGFEILYRNNVTNKAQFDDNDAATLQLLANYCSGIFDNLDEPHVKIFINMTRELILSDIFLPLSPDRVVIEILEHCTVDVLLIERITTLKKQGYIFAVDDYHINQPHLKQLFLFVDYIKVDVLAMNNHQLHPFVQTIKSQLGSNNKAILLAEKVETNNMLNECKNAGFALFQGYFLSKPEIIFGRKVGTDSQNILQLLCSLEDESVTINTISTMVSKDIKLTYQLLKIINSPLCRLPNKVENIHEAIIYLGLKAIKKWAMILILTEKTTCPHDLIRIFLERAKLCEILAKSIDNVNSDTAFTVGLFSGIDLVLQAEKTWLLEQIMLSIEVTNAILHKQGILGTLLQTIEHLEQADFVAINQSSIFISETLYVASIEAYRWVNETLKTLP